MLAKEVVRCFNLYDKGNDQECLETNINSDLFSSYRKINFAYADDDFVYQQKEMIPTAFVNQSNPAKKDAKKEDLGPGFKIEPKDKANCKAVIANIDWSVDGR